MTGSDDNTGNGHDGNGGESARRKRPIPPVTIEGEAHEVSEPDSADETPGAEQPLSASADETQAAEPAETGDGEPAAEPAADSGEAGESEAAPDESEQAAAAEEDEPADETAAPPAGEAPLPTARRASVIAAGLVGALIALAIYLGLYYGGVLPRDRTALVDTLATQVEEARRHISGIESTLARNAKRDNTKALTEKVSGLENAVKELGADPRNSLVRRMSDAEAKLEQLSESATDSQAAKDIESRLTWVEDKVTELASAGSVAGTAAAGDLENRLADIDKRLGEVEARPAVVSADGKPIDDAAAKALADRIAALDDQMKETASTVAELKKTATADSADRLKQVDTTLAAMRTELDKLGSRLDSVSKDVAGKIGALEKSLSEQAKGAPEMVRATAGTLALTALERTVDSGNAYSSELDALKPLIDESADISALAAHAGTGVPDLAALQSGFAAVSNAILTAGEAPESGLVGSLLTSARSLVKVRPTGVVQGEGRGAAVARIEAALQAGDLKTAESEWNGLDDDAKAASKAWADGLKARIAVYGALSDLSSSLSASLAGATAKN